MMTLISLAIVVAFVASAAATLGFFEVDVWWELATLITIMVLGHWLEMKAISQARGALDALAALLPDRVERVTESGIEEVSLSEFLMRLDLETDQLWAVSCVSLLPTMREYIHAIIPRSLGVVDEWDETCRLRCPQRKRDVAPLAGKPVEVDHDGRGRSLPERADRSRPLEG